ncbi:MAG: prepilin peptidase [Actinobacteria bacterium]|nr:prepilin peptidase [Actinomycetota bacterium]
MIEAAVALGPALAVGSFLNVVVARVPERRSLGGRSGCPGCSAPIAWYDNIPVVSYLLLFGRCRSCGERISPLYPAVEILTTILVSAAFWRFGFSSYGALAAAFSAVLVALAAIDFTHRIVPNRIVVPAAGVALVAHTLMDPSAEWAIAAFGAAGFFLAAALLYPGGLGMGDVKLALLLGAVLGRAVTLAIMVGLIVALIPSAVLVARHGSKARKMAIPLVPFLAAGALVALYTGSPLLRGYASLIG